MLAALGLEDPVRVLAADGEGGALEARLLARARLEQLDLEAALGGPALVHPQHHLRPVLRVGAARAGLERDDRVAGVVLAVEERRLLEQAELAPERDDRRLDLRPPCPGRARAGRRRRSYSAVSRSYMLEPLGDAGVLGRDLLRALLVVPEAGLAQLLLELGDPALERSRVKGNHGPRRAGPRSPSSCSWTSAVGLGHAPIVATPAGRGRSTARSASRNARAFVAPPRCLAPPPMKGGAASLRPRQPTLPAKLSQVCDSSCQS